MQSNSSGQREKLTSFYLVQFALVILYQQSPKTLDWDVKEDAPTNRAVNLNKFDSLFMCFYLLTKRLHWDFGPKCLLVISVPLPDLVPCTCIFLKKLREGKKRVGKKQSNPYSQTDIPVSIVQYLLELLLNVNQCEFFFFCFLYHFPQLEFQSIKQNKYKDLNTTSLKSLFN